MNDYKIKHKGNVILVKDISDDFIDKTATVCKVIDNGNGYTVKFPSHSSVYPDIYMNIDYAQAEYLFLAFGYIMQEGRQ